MGERARVTSEVKGNAARRPPPERVPAVVAGVLASPGRALEPEARGAMEARLGHDFGRVRVHADARASEAAHAVGARAFTVGRDLVFRSGAYAPATPSGARLLAHELAHVVQQGGAASPTPDPAGLRIGGVDDPAEREAERVAEAAVGGGEARPMAAAIGSDAAPTLRRAPGDAPAAAATPAPDPAAEERVLPFAPGEIGGPLAWDGAKVLQVSGIDPASPLGKAIAAGPDGANGVTALVKDLAARAGKHQATPGLSIRRQVALEVALILLVGVNLRIITRQLTYREIARLASLQPILSRDDAEATTDLVAWAYGANTPEANDPDDRGLTPSGLPQPGKWSRVYGDTPRTKTLVPYETYKAGLGPLRSTTEAIQEKGGRGTPAAPEISYEALLKAYPGMAEDIAAGHATEEKGRAYLGHLNTAFKIMKIDTVEAQANYLAHAFVESDQFRQFTETQGWLDTKRKKGDPPVQKWVDDPTKLRLDTGYLERTYNPELGPRPPKGTKAEKEWLTAKQRKESVNPYGNFEFIGRGPVQATHDYNYMEVVAHLEVAVEHYEKDALKGDKEAKRLAKLAREAANAIKADPVNAARPEYAFLVSAAYMKRRGSDVTVGWSGGAGTWTGDDPGSGWVAGGTQTQAPQVEALGIKSRAYDRIRPILLCEAIKAGVEVKLPAKERAQLPC